MARDTSSSTNAMDIIAGVFTQESEAQQALDALRAAGFGYDDIGVATHARRKVDLLHDFLDLGVSRERASYYDQEYRNGRTIVSVRADGREQEVASILRNNGGYDYGQQSSSTQMAGTVQNAQPATTSTAQTTTTGTTDTAITQGDFYQPRTLKVREEQLNVDKQRVQAGEASLHKDVVEEQKTVNVPVTHEEVYVERRPVTNISDAADDTTPIGTDETIRVPVSEEKVNVDKNTVVTGEVAIGKRAVQETQQVSDTVKREHLHATETGDAPIHGTQSDYLHPDSPTKEPVDIDVDNQSSQQ